MKNKRIAIELSEEIYYKVKVYCATQKITIKEFLTDLIKDKINQG